MVYAFEINSTTFPAGKFTSFGPLINFALSLALTGAGLIFLAMTLYAAFNILTHGDNPDALKKAYASITTAVLGLIIVVASYLVIKLLGALP